nr:dna repair protein rhp41 [Quercus suber]
MAPSRGAGKGKARARSTQGAVRPLTRGVEASRRHGSDVKHVYQDMLDEVAGDVEHDSPERPLKRRRANPSLELDEHAVQSHSQAEGDLQNGNPARNIQTTRYQNSQTIEQSSDDESDLAFEDVDIDVSQTGDSDDGDGAPGIEIADVTVTLNQSTKPSRNTQINHRKPATAAEKARRLLIHKAHFLCLLAHCMFVNSWCNNTAVQTHIRPVLSKRTVDWFDDRSQSQAARHLTFIEALQKCRDDFLQHFNVTASSINKAQWTSGYGSDGTSLNGDPQDVATLISAAKRRQGSQDSGNQLFCALLRSIGIEARLVCSLQLLPFGSTSSRTNGPQATRKNTIHGATIDEPLHRAKSERENAGVRSSESSSVVPPTRRRLGQPAFASGSAATQKLETEKNDNRKLSYPVWWIEAFDQAYQKWIPVDAVVTRTVNKPTRLEPPSTYHDLNQLVYVIAMESSGIARDVTRRYAKAYNAKTRRFRVESTENGAQWLKKAMKVFCRTGSPTDRDQVEDAELSQREAKEGLPHSIQDFKGHPYFALERHLKRHEVLFPRRQIGKVNAGTAGKPKMEAVFRRQDVLLARSADRWFRLGREVKPGEQPIKHIDNARRPREVKQGDNGQDEDLRPTTTALYSFAQTTLYVPLPVVNGRVPRNGFGNLDVYVPSMIPAGGRHLRHTLTQQAARLLRVDYADAVTGFQFKNRKGVAIIEGAVVPAAYAKAVEAVTAGMEWLQEEQDSRRRSLAALKLWKKFLIGLNVRQQVHKLGEVEAQEELEIKPESAINPVHLDVVPSLEDRPMPTAGRYTVFELNETPRTQKNPPTGKHNREDDLLGTPDDTSTPNAPLEYTADLEHDMQDRGGGFIPSDIVEHPHDDDLGGSTSGHNITSDDAYTGGGFLVPEDANDASDNNANDSDNGNDHDNRDGMMINRALEKSREDWQRYGFDHDNNGHGQGCSSPGDRDVPDDGITHRDNLDDDGDDDDERKGSETTGKGLHVAEEGEKTHGRLAVPETEGQADAQHCHFRKPRKNADQLGNEAAEAQDVGGYSKTASEVWEGSDHGSLLSHDPDDEDVEPDWLESD